MMTAGIRTRRINRYPFEQAHLFSPWWHGSTAHGEAVALLQTGDGGFADGTLYFTPERVLRVQSSDGRTAFEPGRDYDVDAARRRLVLLPGSRIPFLQENQLYPAAGRPRSIPHRVHAPDQNLLYSERWFPGVQVVVDYTHADPWSGYVPARATASLPRTMERLTHARSLKIAVTGDSITVGANASKTIPPYMPAYVELVRRGLARSFASRVSALNLARPRVTAEQGVRRISALAAVKPDLVLVAFGMNDTHQRDPDGFRRRIATIIDGVRSLRPETEFILVATSRANPEWHWSPAEEFPRYAAALRSLTGPGVALADLTALWTDLLARKRYLDLTGNGINHPNDFGHRLYAQTLLALLVGSSPSALLA
ncbi:MAG TPA: SGNH/GDSL hydrolase family protein [Opitutaceae bacterium]|nr:SGNH/GDSL hydrolase family protein [Opitutaceae bacterium]